MNDINEVIRKIQFALEETNAFPLVGEDVKSAAMVEFRKQK